MPTLSEQVSSAVAVLELSAYKAKTIVETDAVVTTESGDIESLPMILRKAGESVAEAVSAMVPVKIYVTEAIGRAATDDGGYFATESVDRNVSLSIYRRISASSSEYIADVPSDAAVQDTGKVKRYPRSKKTSDALVGCVGGTTVHLPVSQKMPRSKTVKGGLVLKIGETIIDLQSALSPTKVLGSPHIYPQPVPSGIAVAQTVNGEQQITLHENGHSTPLTGAGANWISPVVGPFNVVRCLKDSGASLIPYSITPSGHQLKESAVLLHKLITGQSLALGSRGFVLGQSGAYEFMPGEFGDLFTESIPAEYKAYCLSLKGGPRPVDWAASSEFEPIREYHNGVTGESIASSWALALRKWSEVNTRINPRLLASISAFGGVSYESLKKGTATYSNAIDEVQKANDIATSMGLSHIVHSISIIHGESQINTAQSEYVSMLSTWVSDYQSDISAITGQSIPPIAFISQMLTGEAGTIPAIPLAQLQAHDENVGICLIGPKYAYPYYDTYHMLAEGYVKIGEIEARAERFYLSGKKWQPLKPLDAECSGTTLTIRFNNAVYGGLDTAGPIGNLVIDTNTITDPGDCGFAVAGIDITKVAVGNDGSSIILTLATAPSAGAVVTYALQSDLVQPGGGKRGNLRDSDYRDTSRFDDAYLYNWCVAFSQPITII